MIDFGIFDDGREENKFRLQERYRYIIAQNLDAIKGKSVLDIAANNGRWSYAALVNGAESLVSIEGRKDRAEDAKRFIAELGYGQKCEINIGDMFDFLHLNRDKKFDTVFCLGIYYHIMDHSRLLRLIARLEPDTIIIDSGFVRSFRNTVHIQTEDPSKHLNALTVFEGQKHEPVGFISLGLMISLAWNLGYNCRPMIWDPNQVAKPLTVQDYMMGRRYTLRLQKMDGNVDKDWIKHWMPALVALKPEFSKLFDVEMHDSVSDDRARRPLENAKFTIL